jgi:hypothetical protein
MMPSPPRLEVWPLLPRPLGMAGRRPEDEPVRAALVALVGLAALFLALRWVAPGLAREAAMLVALCGSLAGFALTLVMLALLVGAAVVTPMMSIPEHVARAGLAAFDHAVHLAFVLTASGLLGMIVLHGAVPGAAMWVGAQAVMLWGFHRTRLWLTGTSAA